MPSSPLPINRAQLSSSPAFPSFLLPPNLRLIISQLNKCTGLVSSLCPGPSTLHIFQLNIPKTLFWPYYTSVQKSKWFFTNHTVFIHTVFFTAYMHFYIKTESQYCPRCGLYDHFTSCFIFCKLIILSVPPYIICKMGINNSMYFI